MFRFKYYTLYIQSKVYGSADGYNILKLGDRVEIYVRVKV